MTSRKIAGGKRATLPRLAVYGKAFAKDWERHFRTGRADLVAAKAVMLLLLANDAPLPPQYKDHALTGDWQDFRDCHVHGDLLLIYQIEGAVPNERVVFTRLGTHSEVFG